MQLYTSSCYRRYAGVKILYTSISCSWRIRTEPVLLYQGNERRQWIFTVTYIYCRCAPWAFNRYESWTL